MSNSQRRPLSRQEAFVLGEIQAYWGPQNTVDRVFFSAEGEAVLFVIDADGALPLAVNLTNMGAWHEDGTLTLEEFREQIKGPDGLATLMMPLLDEAVDVWRPVKAQPLPDGRYRIVSQNPDPEDEHWAFATGQVVLCETRTLEDGRHLVPVSVASDPA